MGDANAQPHLVLEMLSQARFLAAARTMVGALAQRLGFNEIHSGQISLAVDEALCNIINHGYEKRDDGRIWLRVWVHENHTPGLQIVIEDNARQVDPEAIRSRNLEDIRPGGLGVYLINEIMDEVRYERRETEGMRLTMFKALPQDDSAEHSESVSPGESESDHA